MSERPSENEPPAATVHPFDALATIGCVYLALLTAGFAAFRYLATLPVGASRNPDRAFFTSANAASLTGFAQATTAVRDYPALGQWLLATLAVGSALTTLIGGGYLLARALRRDVSVARLAAWSVALVALPLLAGPFVGAFDATSAATTLGLTTGEPRGPIARAVLVALSTPSLLGVLPILQLLGRRAAGDDRGYLAKSVVACAVAVIAGAVLLALAGAPWFVTFTQSLSLRGFGAAGYAVNATAAMPWTTTVLAMLGAAPSGLAGGLGALPIVVIGVGAWDALRGRAIDPLLGVAIAWVAAFGAAFIVAMLVLSAIEPAVPGERLLLLVAAALGNVGVSHEPVGMTQGSLFTLSATMLVGRTLPLVMLAWMACVVERAAVTAPRAPGSS